MSYSEPLKLTPIPPLVVPVPPGNVDCVVPPVVTPPVDPVLPGDVGFVVPPDVVVPVSGQTIGAWVEILPNTQLACKGQSHIFKSALK